MFNNYVIANCPQNVKVKKFENWLIFGEDTENDKVGRFWRHGVFPNKKNRSLTLPIRTLLISHFIRSRTMSPLVFSIRSKSTDGHPDAIKYTQMHSYPEYVINT